METLEGFLLLSQSTFEAFHVGGMPSPGSSRVDLLELPAEKRVRIVAAPPGVDGFEHAREGHRVPSGMVGQQHRRGFLDVFHQERIEASVAGNVRCVRLEHEVSRPSLFQRVQQSTQGCVNLARVRFGGCHVRVEAGGIAHRVGQTSAEVDLSTQRRGEVALRR